MVGQVPGQHNTVNFIQANTENEVIKLHEGIS